ncbi:MAG: hypothetical protein HYS46_07040 [Betaproteobacteria bacterium]|nr:hypothetical protein [Betaproteobacteria bacterium]
MREANARRELLKLAGAALAASSLPGLAQQPSFSDADRTRNKIVALIRPSGETDPKAMLRIQKIEPVAEVRIAGVTAKPEQLPLIDHFVGHLQIRYSFDDPRFVTAVSASDLKRLKLRREELLPLSVANFRRLYPKFRIERLQPHLAVVVDAGELEPSLMLDFRFWDEQKLRAGADIVASVPARDTLLFADRRVTGYVDTLKGVTADVYAGAGKDALASTLFLWNQGRWEVFG